MTFAAGDGNVGMIDGRVRIVGGDDFVNGAVAVGTIGCGRTCCCRFCMGAVRIGGLCVGMASVAGEFLRRSLMRERLHVGVAIDAAEHGAMNGVLEFGAVDEKAVRLAVHCLRQGRVAVTGEAVFVFQLVFRQEGRCRERQEQNNTACEKPAYRVHTFTMVLMQEARL